MGALGTLIDAVFLGATIKVIDESTKELRGDKDRESLFDKKEGGLFG